MNMQSRDERVAVTVVLVSVLCLALVACTPSRSLPTQNKGDLLVYVHLVRARGAPNSERPNPTALPYEIVAGVIVRVLMPTPPNARVAEQAADARGAAHFTLSPGTYWVAVSINDPALAKRISPLSGSNLPNGQPAHAWQEVTISSSGRTEVTLFVADLPM
jgi:hypothetical protein